MSSSMIRVLRGFYCTLKKISAHIAKGGRHMGQSDNNKDGMVIIHKHDYYPRKCTAQVTGSYSRWLVDANKRSKNDLRVRMEVNR